MSMQTQIHKKLSAEFAPIALEVIDESEQHRGHGGWREGGETHFRVMMTTDSFAGVSRVGRQRAVNKILAEELATTVHALAMELKAPGE
ncbi:MAG: BolA family protein [Pseudomonadota bacterium]